MIKGNCECGRVQYEVDAEIGDALPQHADRS